MININTLKSIFIYSAMTLMFFGCGGGSGGSGTTSSTDGDMVIQWNTIANEITALDHTPIEAGESRTFGEQFGPTKVSRAQAMMHIAIFDAVNAIVGGYDSYASDFAASPDTSLEAAISQAAHDVLVSLYPSRRDFIDQELIKRLDEIPDGQPKSDGISLGEQTAASIISLRANDRSPTGTSSFSSGNAPGQWRADPLHPQQGALDPHWGKVTPFAMDDVNNFLVAPPPPLSSKEYADAYNEVKSIGGDGINTPTIRTEDQTIAGIFWGYDGTKSLCAPPRLYNSIVKTISAQNNLSLVENARLFALANIAMADAGIASWYSKYHYKFWRPITAIRESDPGTGPTGRGDGNSLTEGDPNWTPLGAPDSNGDSNFTPPFPGYTSGHATFGGALFETLRQYFGRDDISFTVVSDEFNGETVGSNGEVRPYLPRTFSSFSEAEEENGQSRIYLGIHFSFDKTQGIAQGRRIGSLTYNTLLRPK